MNNIKNQFSNFIIFLDGLHCDTEQIFLLSQKSFDILNNDKEEINNIGIEYEFEGAVQHNIFSCLYLGYTLHFTTSLSIFNQFHNKTPGLKIKGVPLDRILVKQDEGEAEMAGFEIPDSERQKPHSGIVVKVGPGGRDHEGRLIPMTVSVGDRVNYNEFVTTTVNIFGEDYILIKEGDLNLIY